MASTGSVGTLSWSAKLDSNEFKKGVKRVKKQVQEAQKAVVKSVKLMASSFGLATSAIAGTTAALGAMVLQSATAIKEIENLSRLADTSFNDFVKLAEGARRFGISNEKLADILKDVKDRVGDFLATGGGPMRDFFEKIAPKVGVTAQAFKDLSGKDALQLFFNSLEKANLSQAETVFYLEAMASDLTALQPLLKNNGELFKKIGDEAERFGLILPDDKVEDLKNAMRGFDDLGVQITSSVRNISAELAPTFTELTNDISKILKDSDVELKILFKSIGDYFSLTVDGMREALIRLGIIDEFYSWQDAFKDVAFFIQNTFNFLYLGVAKASEKFLSVLSFGFRGFFAGLFKSYEAILKRIKTLFEVVGKDTTKINESIQDIQNSIIALDVKNLAGAFDGTLSGKIEDELAIARQEFDKTVKDLEQKTKQLKKKADPKILEPKSEGVNIGGVFGAINNGFKIIEKGVKFLKKPNKFFNEGIKKFNKDKKEEKEFETITKNLNNNIATAGSIEEFNLITAQRNQELELQKKQLKELEKLNKDKKMAANFS